MHHSREIELLQAHTVDLAASKVPITCATAAKWVAKKVHNSIIVNQVKLQGAGTRAGTDTDRVGRP